MKTLDYQQSIVSASVMRRWRILSLFGLILVILLVSCPPDIPITPTQRAENALNNAINKLNNTSADWLAVLQDLKREIPDELNSVITQVDLLISRNVAKAGVELRCNVDFVHARIKEDIERILISLKGGTPSPKVPYFCQVVPLAIDRSLVPGTIKQIEFYGYNFDKASNLKIYHVRSSGSEDVTRHLDRPIPHYAMTLKFGASGVQLDNSSERFSLEWEGRTIATIGIIQNVCETSTDPFRPSPVTLMPRKIGNSDNDFNGHGPTVSARVTLQVYDQSISANVYMKAYESNSNNSIKSDYTTLEETKTFLLYNAPSGYRIDRVLGPKEAFYQYRDTDHDPDYFNMGSGGPVNQFAFIGDIDGEDVGQTQVEITFNQLNIELIRTGNCVSPNTVISLKKDNLIQDVTFQKLMSESKALQKLEVGKDQLKDVPPDSTR